MEDRTKKFGWDNWVKELNDICDKGGDYDFDEIVEQLERGDYSSLDPDFVKEHVEIEESPEQEKKKRIASSPSEASL